VSGPPRKAQRNPLPPPSVADGKLLGFDLSGRRAIVYGAETALGGAIIDTFREAGATVGVTSTSTDGAVLFALKKAAAGGPAEATDLRNATNVQVATRKLAKTLGGLDVGVVIAEAAAVSPIGRTASADYEAIVAGNLTVTYNVFRSVAKELSGQQIGGRLIVVLSPLAVRGMAAASASGAGQAGVLGLVRSLSQELAPLGTTVNAIVTGWLDESPLGTPDRDDDALERHIPLGRFGRPDEIAPLAVYLASQASGFLTGQALYVDGGLLNRS
jgi:NAD(P)-dependent dehydrogenase (short-subunit alcohol dehydrogenase family)